MGGETVAGPAEQGGPWPPQIFPDSIVGIDQTLKPIKVFKYWPPQIFVPSAGTGLLQAPGVYLEEHSYLDQLHR